MTALLSRHLPVEGLTVHIQDEQKATLTTPTASSLVLKDSHVLFAVEDGRLKVSTLKRKRKHLGALYGTWTKAIARLLQDKVHKLTVAAHFKHFPISMVIKGDKVHVLNYMGGKLNSGEPTPLPIPIPPEVTCTLIDPRNLQLSSKNRVLLGNVANQFKALRYKTHLKDMDRRRFWDGFIIQ